MSYILDALKKSDKQRQQENVPDLNTVQLDPPQQKDKKGSWTLPLAAIVILNVAFTIFVILRYNHSVPEGQVVAISGDTVQQGHVQGEADNVAPQENVENAPDIVISKDNEVAGQRDEVVAAEVDIDKVHTEELALLISEPSEDVAPEAVKGTGEAVVINNTPLRETTALVSNREAAGSIEQDEDLIVEQEVSAIAEAPVETPQESLVDKALLVYQLPDAVRQQLPDIHIDAHLFYKDRPSSRFASINGKIMREGNMLSSNLKVAEISPEGVVFSYQKYLFYVPVF